MELLSLSMIPDPSLPFTLISDALRGKMMKMELKFLSSQEVVMVMHTCPKMLENFSEGLDLKPLQFCSLGIQISVLSPLGWCRRRGTPGFRSLGSGQVHHGKEKLKDPEYGALWADSMTICMAFTAEYTIGITNSV